MLPIIIPLPLDATLPISFDEPLTNHPAKYSEDGFSWSDGMHMDFTQWVKVTHDTKNKVKSKIPRSNLDELGCDNPDIWVVSKTKDTIVLTPSKTALKNNNFRKTKVVTDLSAEEILGQGWQSKINTLNFYDRWDSLMRVVTPNQGLWEAINQSLDNRKLMGVIYSLEPRTLILLLRGKNSRRPSST